MSSVLHPVGPESRRTYWLRRLALLGGAVLIIVVIALFIRAAIASGDSDGKDPVAQPTSATTGPVVSCAASNLTVTVAPTAPTVPADQTVSLSASVQNVGSQPCTVDLGGEQFELTIVSGSDRVFSTSDCPETTLTSKLVLLDPQASEPAPLTWDKTRSAEGCPTGLPEPKPGTYKATVSVNGATSDAARFVLE